MSLFSAYRHALLLIFSIAVVLALGYSAFMRYESAAPEMQTLLPGKITIRGEMVCLPHKNLSGPQTLECAFGLKDAQGRYFALSDTDPGYRNLSGTPTGVPIVVEGTLVPKLDSVYRSVGVIEVTSITLADVPQRATLRGTYVCLPHTESPNPGEQCYYALQTDAGEYYALDFHLFSGTRPQVAVGDKIEASGIVTPVEQMNADIWRLLPVKGVLSVTDSFRKL